ncbi:MAG: hypothetical protein ACWA5P_06955 [bacterium]
MNRLIYDPTSDIGSPYFRNKYDMILGTINDSGSFITLYYPSNRFELYKES